MTDVTAERALSPHELRERQLRILDAVAAHCTAHGLRWFLFAGTLLGARRHRGYIPWDDDIDLQMPRPDYERFCRTFGVDRDDGLSVRSLGRDPAYALPFAKVCDDSTRLEVESGVVEGIGVFVDVFPFDGWRDGRVGGWAQRTALRALLTAVRAKHLVRGRRRGPWRNAVLGAAQLATRPLPARTLARWITRVATAGDYDRCDQVGALCWGTLECYPRAAFRDAVPLLFEGRTVPGPIGLEEVLTLHYGDYRQLPPPEQRVTHHRFRAFARVPRAD